MPDQIRAVTGSYIIYRKISSWSLALRKNKDKFLNTLKNEHRQYLVYGKVVVVSVLKSKREQ